MSIAKAMRKADYERKEIMNQAQEFLDIIDAWSKTKAETAKAALVTPFIRKIALIVTAFAIGTVQTFEPLCKTPKPCPECGNNGCS